MKMEGCPKIVVTGEVNSGKSTLIGRFLLEMDMLSDETIRQIKNTCQQLGREFELAYLLDSLEEERTGELTIDTTQIFCRDKRGNGFLFIDVPGHRQLFKNMLCGSSCADAALLVIDIKKTIEEGTRRHLDVLAFLGINKIGVVLNKLDTVNFKEQAFYEAKSKVLNYLKQSGLQTKFIIPASAKGGENILKRSERMLWYGGLSLYSAINTFNNKSKRENNNGFCFPIQDTYYLGKDTVFAGTVLSGNIKKGDAVVVLPSRKKTRIEKIKIFNKFTKSAKENESIGILLKSPTTFGRGQIICRNTTFKVTNKILAKIFCVRSLCVNQRIILKYLTQNIPARIVCIKKLMNSTTTKFLKIKKAVKETDVAKVVIASDDNVAVIRSRQLGTVSRFILEDDKGICAAGIIIKK